MSLSFSHSGDSGDAIFSLSLIKALGGGSMYLSQSTATRELMTEERAQFLMPLIAAQPYIEKVEMYRGQQVAYNLDYFREYWFAKAKGNTSYDGTTIVDWHHLAFDQPAPDVMQPWLETNGAIYHQVVINRTARYHGIHFPWKQVVERYKSFGDNFVFIGLPEEHEKFVSEFGFVKYRPVRDALEIARVINGAKLFIGNQSLPEAIAEGLKKPKIVEVPTLPPTSLYARPGAQYVISKNIYLPAL